jgi:hypothetical protein
MGYANAQRSLDYIRTITEFISQPEYAPVVPLFSIVNEVVTKTVGIDVATRLCVILPLSTLCLGSEQWLAATWRHTT